MQYAVTRKKGTERAVSGENLDTKDTGIYCCVCCGSPLFGAAAKFDSGTGWPSFTAPVKPTSLRTDVDNPWHGRRT